MKHIKSKVLWGVLIVFLILLAYVLPYTVLSGIHAWYGSFLLWGIIGLLIIIANFMVTKDWGK
ncbi:hypothetical protein [Virgibacillus litoralis]|uniref:Glucan phosphoethanolaminetransferase (Alkaline phosphatase superfamily) n=1 Tax=Virgibacillus litoralis TaxID=578221 RepID=A0ABS4HB58_9BACI|nr:hypothetical protein [Virgibacillus litoralis]MBP1948144.1 glucan phosphoethanolaminetransferase (alkaline phosphatase superfamily) [Virgibacillus litoralis]